MITRNLGKLSAVVSAPPAEVAIGGEVESFVARTVEYLNSEDAQHSIDVDAYWPKWDSPWWHMLALQEMGLAGRIPAAIVERIILALDRDFLKFFPIREEELPPGGDPLKIIACHCQLGTMHQLFIDYGIDVDGRLPWLRSWYLRYQIADGGLNCDEAAYTKAVPKSSVVSTLPPAEAVLRRGELMDEEVDFLNRAASYLIAKKLYRASNGQPISSDWTKLCFPRFYHYDILRGLAFLVNWSTRFNAPLPCEAIQESVEIIDAEFPNGVIAVQRAPWHGANSRFWNVGSKSWSKGAATYFPLLEFISKTGETSPYLTCIWNDTRQRLVALMQKELIV